MTFPESPPDSGSGTFSVSGSDIVFLDEGGSGTSSGILSDDDNTITVSQVGEDGETVVMEFTRS